MKLSNRNIFAFLAATASLLTSCSDDVLLREGPIDEDSHGVVLLLPNIPENATPITGTRGDGQLIGYTRAESTMDKRKVFLYPVNPDGSVQQTPYEFQDGEFTSLSSIGAYSRYQLTVPPGNYKIYITANVDLADDITYDNLRKFQVAIPTNPEAGIPMSCTNEELDIKRGNANETKVGDGYVTINPGEENLTITAKMKYCVAKVRVTTLNDIKPKDLVNGISVSGHLSSSSIFPGVYGQIRDTKQKEETFKAQATYTVPETWGKYYKETKFATTSVGDSNVEPSNLGAVFTPSSTNNDQAYTHQSVFYVPERLFQEGDDVTTVNLKIGNNEIPIQVGAPDGTGATQKIVQRSHFYDYVGAADGKFYLQVQEWNPDIIAGSINGNYWLEVDKTSISVTAGSETQIAYKASAPIDYKCETHGTEKIYDISKNEETGILTISLNKDIDRSEFEAIRAGNAWRYIQISCGTIVKKIEVTSLDYQEYIHENTMVTIDVNERKTSGDYSNYIPVNLNTNVKYISFSKDNWPTELTDETFGDDSRKSLVLQDENGNLINVGEKIEVPESGEINFRIAYNDLNSQRKLWQQDKNMQVVVKALDNNGQVIINNGREVTCTVGVYIRTTHDTYRIHFKATDWNHPHIYVYQCLQLPGDLDETRTKGHAKQTVGYQIGGATYAALEYDFTGAVAFKGWYSDDNNNPYKDGKTGGYEKDYFYMFSDNYTSQTNNWSPGLKFNIQGGGEIDNLALKNGLHYNRMDFASVHRKQLKEEGRCSACTGDVIPTAWPGIHMIPDPTKPANSGWWYFELSGVADAGRALVMFTDCSENSHNYFSWMERKRYPKQEKPGVALFDNAAKEGWFEYVDVEEGLFFRSTDPDED